MDILTLLGYLAAAFIGISLGLTGAGGSILTVPILVYLIGLDPIQSTAYSLFIVGSVASMGAVGSYRKGEVNLRVGLYFGIPSIITIFLTRKFFINALPTVLFRIGDVEFTKGGAILILFAVLMILSSIRMIRSRSKNEISHSEPDKNVNLKLILQGALVGFITGLVGAGGGFLIIPALVLLANLPMKKAIGTSLLIVCSNAFIGFLGDISERPIDWLFLLPFTAIAVGGIFVGFKLKDKIDGARLKKFFGYFIMVVAISIIITEILSV